MWRKPAYLHSCILCFLLLTSEGNCQETDRNSFDQAPFDELMAIGGSQSETFQENSLLNKYPANSEYWRVLSFTGLIEDLKQKPGSDTVVNTLDQLGWVEGYVIDKRNNDLLLIGRDMPSWPDLYVDELLLLDQAVLTGTSHPYCSLDPYPENVLAFNNALSQKESSQSHAAYFNNLQDAWGPQEVRVGGVPEKSSVALTMLDADYHMKKVTQGHVQVVPLQSLLDIRLEQSLKDNDASASRPNSSRYWFNCKSEHPLLQVAEDITLLESCDIILLTEAQASSSSGELFDSGEDDPVANQWAKTFSEEFQSLTTQVEVYAQLENLYRLYAIMLALDYNNQLSYANSIIASLAEVNPLQRVYSIPDSYPGLVNLKLDTTFLDDRSYRVSTVFVCGGVSMDMAITEEKVQYSDNLTALADYIKQSRPDSNRSSWRVSSPIEVGEGPSYQRSENPGSEFKPEPIQPLPGHMIPRK